MALREYNVGAVDTLIGDIDVPGRGAIHVSPVNVERIAGMVHAISHHDYQRARRYSDEERYARESLRILRVKYGVTD